MSNLLEKASIITTPTAYENGQLLSVKPNVNENLLSYSEDFSTFTGNVSSVIDNFGLAPNGTQTAAKITFQGQYQNISQSLGFTSGTYTLSCYIKNIDGNSELYLRGTGVALIYAKAITITNEWARYEATFTHNGNQDIEWQLQDRNSSGWGSCLIWGAQIVKGSKVGTYTKTEGTPIPRADFFFERGSSATRVNSQGLIEDVQIIGGDLVQNGDFSQEGSELVTNGDFSTDTNWVKGNGWTIANGKATCTNGNANLAIRTGSLSITNGKFYKVQFTVLDYSSGNISVYLGNNGVSDSFLGNFNANGTYTVYHKLTNSVANYLLFRNGTNGSNYSIDNASVKEVGQNWSLQNGWSIENNKAKFVRDTSDSNIVQANVFTIGSKYRVIIDVDYINNNGGTGRAMLRNPDNTTIQPFLSVGLNEYEIVAQGTNLTVRGERADFEISLNSITVKEIIDDTDIPRIDYTGGVGHILLEPQSTNLVEYSEDFTQSVWTKNNVTIENGYSSPDGLNNAYKATKTDSNSMLYFSYNPTNRLTDSRSIWARTTSGTGQVHLCSFNGNANSLFTITENWQRFDLTGFYIYIAAGASAFYAVDFRGSSTLSEIILWGGQAEDNPFPTSYIPTVGSTVTRLGETLTNSGNADLFNSEEGVLYAEIGALTNISTATKRVITLKNTDSSKRASIIYNTDSTLAFFFSESTPVYNLILTSADDITQSFTKWLFKYKAK